MSAASDRCGTLRIARIYVFTLVPIAIGYSLAHNYSYLLIQGQEIARLASDPFGLDWDLAGTATWTPNIAAAGARSTWYVAIGAIVGGHIIAVWLAHVVALRSSPSRAHAIRALVPLSVLMMLYTGASLLVLAEPMVRFNAADQETRAPSSTPQDESPEDRGSE